MAVISNAARNIIVYVFVGIYVSLGYIPKSGFAELYVNSMGKPLKN